MTANQPALRVENLRVALHSGVPIIDDVTLELEPGTILGIVGESGSGKTTLSVALLGFCRPGAHIASGNVDICGERMTGRNQCELELLRRRLISYVPQDAVSSLNPSLRVGEHIIDRLRHRPRDERQVLARRALIQAQLPDSSEFRARYPHQLSGGQQQRLLIAMSVAADPRVIVLDEPTTGLDVVVQSRILAEVARLRDRLDVAIVYVSHDVAAVATVADRLAVMYAGRIVEQGPASEVLRTPRHPYTIGLLESVPDHKRPRQLRGIPGIALGVGQWPSGCGFEPRCAQRTAACAEAVPRLERVGPDHDARCLHWRSTIWRTAQPLSRPDRKNGGATVLGVHHLSASHMTRGDQLVVAAGVSFTVDAGQCVALVGESGSGKTTIARCIVGLHQPDGGAVCLHGQELPPLAGARDREARRRIQIVFQNPYDSLNPRRTALEAIERPALLLRRLSRRDASAEALRALEHVRVPARLSNRYPAELSGGERQRVAIARALAARPDLLVCDEITSSLDVSVQAAVIDVLSDLRADLGLGMLLITHNLGLVASIAHTVLVLDRGRICERGATRLVLRRPKNDYTKTLVAAAPHIEAPYPPSGATDEERRSSCPEFTRPQERSAS
jgi:peptide/nickel transport system ATP-binding protein